MGSTAVENCHTALLTFSLALTAAARGVIPSGKPLNCSLAQIGKSTRYNAGHSNSGQRQLPALRTFARHPSGSPELIACMSASEKAGSNTSHSIPSKADLAGNREVYGALLRRTRSPVRPSSPGSASAAAADRTQGAAPHSAPPSNWCRASQGPPSVRSGPLSASRSKYLVLTTSPRTCIDPGPELGRGLQPCSIKEPPGPCNTVRARPSGRTGPAASEEDAN